MGNDKGNHNNCENTICKMKELKVNSQITNSQMDLEEENFLNSRCNFRETSLTNKESTLSHTETNMSNIKIKRNNVITKIGTFLKWCRKESEINKTTDNINIKIGKRKNPTEMTPPQNKKQKTLHHQTLDQNKSQINKTQENITQEQNQQNENPKSTKKKK